MLSSKEIQRIRALKTLAQSEAWRHFEDAANELIRTYSEPVECFNANDATRIASKAVFVSGIRRCLGLVTTAVETELPDSDGAGD